jgi:hypothetical protein
MLTERAEDGTPLHTEGNNFGQLTEIQDKAIQKKTEEIEMLKNQITEHQTLIKLIDTMHSMAEKHGQVMSAMAEKYGQAMVNLCDSHNRLWGEHKRLLDNHVLLLDVVEDIKKNMVYRDIGGSGTDADNE